MSDKQACDGMSCAEADGAIADLSGGGDDLSQTHFDMSLAQTRWPLRFGGSELDKIAGAALDSRGNLVAIGSFRGLMNFKDPADKSDCPDLQSAGSSDIFLVQFASNGTCLWARQIGGDAADDGLSVSIDSRDQIVITGTFQNVVSFGRAGAYTLRSAGNEDIFLAKYSSAGDCLWAYRYGADGADVGTDVTIDSQNLDPAKQDSIILTGSFRNTVDFGKGNVNVAGGGSDDIFVGKFDKNGGTIRVVAYGSAGSDVGAAVAVANRGGGIAVTGRFSQKIDFCNFGPLGQGLSSSDAFLLHFDNNLSCMHAYAYGDKGEDRGRAVAIQDDIIFLAGTFTNQLSLGGAIFTEKSTGLGDVFIARFASGAHSWSRAFGGNALDWVTSLSLDGGGNVLLTGAFTNTVNFGQGDQNTMSPNKPDIYIVKYAAVGGGPLWSTTLGGSAEDFGSAVIPNADGDLLVGGAFKDIMTVNGNSLRSAGDSDCFVAKLRPPQ